MNPSRYSALCKLEHVPSAFIADALARLQVRFPEIQVVFADSRRFAEEWTYRFLAAAFADATRTNESETKVDSGFPTPSASTPPASRGCGVTRSADSVTGVMWPVPMTWAFGDFYQPDLATWPPDLALARLTGFDPAIFALTGR